MQAMNQWVITPAEARQNDGQFENLQPSNGFVTGDQVRPYFMRSGLPPQILAQIWSLSDLNKDGRMDKAEFNIATHLIRKCLAGFPLPASIPESLVSSARQTAIVAPVMSYAPQPATPQPYPVATSAPGRPPSVPASFPNKTLSDWTIPQSAKLKYSQQFNQLDKSRVGILTGTGARGMLARSQLPTHTLAEIWNLSDVNKDGCLSTEEFCIAMHLIEMVKLGYMLPATLPDELLTMCHQAMKSGSGSPLPDLSQPPAQKSSTLKSFEDKRRDNYDRGQAELDRRRQILLEEEERRKQEQQRKEQEEAARRERERQELERKRELDRQQALKREQELEEARQAEERKIQAEKAEARRKLELQRQMELDSIRVRSLEANKRNEEEKNMHLNQRLKTLTFQKQALDEKTVQLNDQITANRNEIIATTKEIEGMKEKRDRNVAAISMLVNKAQDLSISCQKVAHQVLQAQSDGKFSSDQDKEIRETRNLIDVSCQTLETLKGQVKQYDVNIPTQKAALQQRKAERDELQAKHAVEERLLSALLHEVEQVQNALRERVISVKPVEAQISPVHVHAQANEPFKSIAPMSSAPMGMGSSSNSSNAAGNTLPSVDASTVKYRALYEFVARTEDELSFQPGDTILVFEGHASEPGWLAGQIREKVGWFPQAFAEPVVATPGKSNVRKKSVPTSPSDSLPRIDEERFDSLPQYDVVPPEVSSQPVTNGVAETVICKAIAQYQWKARNPDDMSFVKGDEIEILEQQDIRWRGRLANNHSVNGWFPKSYAKVVVADTPQQKTSPKVEQPEPLPSVPLYEEVPSETSKTEAHLENQHSKPEEGEWYTALYEFKAVEGTDLSLNPGDRIWVTESTDAWWKGTVDGRTGTFPANYVQKENEKSADPGSPTPGSTQTGIAVAAFEALETNQLSLKAGEKVTICSKSENGWWEGEKILENGERATGWFPGNYVRAEDGPTASKSAETCESVLAEALFDYSAAREDELSFKAGDLLEVVDRSDEQWWKGRLQNAPESTIMLFPSNFVRVRAEDGGHLRKETAARGSKEAAKLQRLTQELLETEQKYCTDLTMVQAVFLKRLASAFGSQLVSKIFLNWDELIAISQKLITHLSQKAPGVVFARMKERFRAFVTFCGNQVSAMEELNRLENENLNFKQVYWQCCQDPNVRGLSLGYFLLLPMARVTRYPLLFEKMLKCTEQDDAQFETLTNVYSMLKSLCSDVNHAITEVENMNMLYWSQQYINCDSIKPKLVFPSSTRFRTPRVYLHSGILYKLRSGKMLVAILFNDFLLFTTPTATITDPQSFKLTKSTDLCLNMYKQPCMLKTLSICPPKEGDEEGTLILKSEGTLIYLRATNTNARKMWENQLTKAILQCETLIKEQNSSPERKQKSQIGRLLFEIAEVINMDLEYPCVCEMKMTLSSSQKIQINQSRSQGTPLCSTQFDVYSNSEQFNLGFFFPRQFSPDICAGEVTIPVEDLLNTSVAHRGPILRHVNMQNSDLSKPVGSVIIKFVVQMYS